ncbi:hypothetical protein Ccrd_017477 [Cynara cardunculus var. scolymus]|uniref:Uncharacterized protein n=1 Tax=Cynara cardunculus var. scolymus TaxID=59895 RepID=A0A124SFS8_CYNCS|nr:hypothetical protein Ccrd_017477 [Cynara cardunculus var. scolymus]
MLDLTCTAVLPNNSVFDLDIDADHLIVVHKFYVNQIHKVKQESSELAASVEPEGLRITAQRRHLRCTTKAFEMHNDPTKSFAKMHIEGIHLRCRTKAFGIDEGELRFFRSLFCG